MRAWLAAGPVTEVKFVAAKAESAGAAAVQAAAEIKAKPSRSDVKFVTHNSPTKTGSGFWVAIECQPDESAIKHYGAAMF
jgi:hypothetical protein